MKKIFVRLPYIREEIYVGNNIIQFLIKKIRNQKYDKLVLIVDKNVVKTNKKIVEKIFKKCGIVGKIVLLPIPRYKNYQEVASLIKEMVNRKLTRKSCLIAMGGGYVADMTGFAASIYMRGIDFVQIPTTLMSMGDSIIGKVAVNFNNYKNIVGNFYSPKFVFCNLRFLTSFENDTELIYGLIEIWKHALLAGNKTHIKNIEKFLEDKKNLDLEKLVSFSLKTKAQYVSKDHDDKKGKHKALSLGHTFANYFERNMGLRHGEAVFYGIIMATILAKNLNIIDKKKNDSIFLTARLFEKKIGLIKAIQRKINPDHALIELKFDKINHSSSKGKYSFVIPTHLGYIVKSDISVEILKKSFLDFKKIKDI